MLKKKKSNLEKTVPRPLHIGEVTSKGDTEKEQGISTIKPGAPLRQKRCKKREKGRGTQMKEKEGKSKSLSKKRKT